MISRSTYYKYRSLKDSDYKDYLLIKEVFNKSKKTYGYRRIREGLLIKYGVIFNHKKVARIMHKFNLNPEYIRRIGRNTMTKRIKENIEPNLIKRNFKAKNFNQIWLTDITYLIYRNKRAYLSTIIDLYDRHVVSYKISFKNDVPLVIDTLNSALDKEKDVYGLIIHSDQGFQYTSYEYKAICASKGIIVSMSNKGTPLDNSPMESWHAILKKETLYNNDITSMNHYIELVKNWIKFYNNQRIKLKKPL